MSEQTINELRRLLASDGPELAFLDQIPEPALDELQRAIRSTLDSESESLTEAIASGTAALPAPLRSVAAATLR